VTWLLWRSWATWCSSLLLVSFFGCAERPGAGGSASSPRPAEAVTVSVAASTREAVEEIAAQFRREQNVEVRINSGASSALAAQILAGAPADLFLSANREWAAAVAEQGLTAESVDLLGNRLVIVAPRNTEGLNSPEDLLADHVERIALAGEKVPAGEYADQALVALGLKERLANKIVRGADVRVTLSYVERGEADAGIVYATDAALSQAVRVIAEFPPDSYEPIVYPCVLLRSGERSPAARQFYDYLQSPNARAVFARFGFTSPEK
jgi:molybdate transport system substrate-binding protein